MVAYWYKNMFLKRVAAKTKRVPIDIVVPVKNSVETHNLAICRLVELYCDTIQLTFAAKDINRRTI